MILIPTVVDLDAHRRRRDERLASEVRIGNVRAEIVGPVYAEPATAPVDPRAFCVAAIRRDLAEDFDGPAAA